MVSTPDADASGSPTASRHGSARRRRVRAACLTRYEAWPVTAAALWRPRSGCGGDRRRACPRAPPRASIAVYPAGARSSPSRLQPGRGRAVVRRQRLLRPGNKALGRPLVALAEILVGPARAERHVDAHGAAIGLVRAARRALSTARRRRWLLPLALVASAALPWRAFVEGHPFRIRYMVPLLAHEAIGAGVAGWLASARRRRWRRSSSRSRSPCRAPPLDRAAPMVLEAQWDRPNVRGAAAVTDCLRAATTARRSWRAWDRSATTCRRCRPPGSTCAISCTKATATSGCGR